LTVTAGVAALGMAFAPAVGVVAAVRDAPRAITVCKIRSGW